MRKAGEASCNGKVIVSGRGRCVAISFMDSWELFYGNNFVQVNGLGSLKVSMRPADYGSQPFWVE